MNGVITNILINPEARSAGSVETLALQLLNTLSIPWVTLGSSDTTV